MKNENKIKLKWGGAYLSIVLFFSLIYWGMWSARPDSFIVNKELNMFPISETLEELWGNGNKEEVTQILPGLDELKSQFSNLKSSLELSSREIAVLEKERESLEYDRKRLNDINSLLRKGNIDKYANEHMIKIEVNRKAIEEQISILEELSKQEFEQIKKTYYSIQIANFRVDLAKLGMEEAEKRYLVSARIIENLSEFNDIETINKIKAIEQRSDRISNAMNQHQDVIQSTKAKLQDNLEKWYGTRKNALRYVDFLFYSIGISTTTTFGDVVANSRWVRAVVGVQLILCVFIVGGFVSSVLPKK